MKHYIQIIRRWSWAFLLCTVATGVVGGFFALRQPRVYEAQARYLVGQALDNPSVNSGDLRASNQIGQTYAELATSRPIIERALAVAQIVSDPALVAGEVSALWADKPQILNIRVHDDDPELAARFANAIGTALIERSPLGPANPQSARLQASTQRINQLEEKVRSLETQIEELLTEAQAQSGQPAEQAVALELDQRRAELDAAQRELDAEYVMQRSGNANMLTLIEPAVANHTPISPDLQRDVMLAFLAGAALGVIVVLALEYFDNTVRGAADLRAISGAASLGAIPAYQQPKGITTSNLVMQSLVDTQSVEGYRALRANLQAVIGDARPVTLLVTSAAHGDGKSEVAANLALALAQNDVRVILVDANVRQPRINTLFRFKGWAGLSWLIKAPKQACTLLSVPSMPKLSILPAGSPSADAAEILAAPVMDELIRALKEIGEIIIFDSPPSYYADTTALARKVDGVLLVASNGKTNREQLATVVHTLRHIGANVIGTVLNRSSERLMYVGSVAPAHAPRPHVEQSDVQGQIQQSTGEAQV
jgi:capsular exopolysaccharide synthesis family protein